MQRSKSHLPAPDTGESKPIAPSIFPGLNKELPQGTEKSLPTFRARALVTPGWRPPALPAQESIDTANARAFVYRFLARGFDLPTAKDWPWLCNPTVHTMLCSAIRYLVAHSPSTLDPQHSSLLTAHQLVAELHPGQFEPFANDYLAAFGQREAGTTRLSVPVAGLKQLMRPFGLSLAPSGASATSDYLCVSFEFASWLVIQHVGALEKGRTKEARLYQDAQQKLIRGHLSAWLTALSGKEIQGLQPGLLRTLVTFALEFVALEQLHWHLKLNARAKATQSVRLSAS